jgi:hypothetical protein
MKPGQSPVRLRRFLIAALILGGLFPAYSAPADHKVRLLDLTSDPVLVNDLYLRNRIYRKVAVADDGAVGANIDWERQKSTKWFIEEQREGGDMIQAGIALKDPKWINKGIQVLDWGFSHEAPNGEFTGTADAVHSVSFFVEAVSRAILLLRQADMVDFDSKINQWLPKLGKAAQWLMTAAADPESEQKDLEPFTHRFYLYGAGLGQTALLIHNDAMAAAAAEYIRRGIEKQQPDGTNPEKGSFDAGYQVVGLNLACHYVTICPDPALATKLQAMLVLGLKKELTFMKPDGTVDISSSTRVGKEADRTGKTKGMNYRSLTMSLIDASVLTGDASYRALAEKTAAAAARQ